MGEAIFKISEYICYDRLFYMFSFHIFIFSIYFYTNVKTSKKKFGSFVQRNSFKFPALKNKSKLNLNVHCTVYCTVHCTELATTRTSSPLVKVNSTYMKNKVWPRQPCCTGYTLLVVCFINPMSARYSTNWDRKGWPGSEIKMYYGCLWYCLMKHNNWKRLSVRTRRYTLNCFNDCSSLFTGLPHLNTWLVCE